MELVHSVRPATVAAIVGFEPQFEVHRLISAPSWIVYQILSTGSPLLSMRPVMSIFAPGAHGGG